MTESLKDHKKEQNSKMNAKEKPYKRMSEDCKQILTSTNYAINILKIRKLHKETKSKHPTGFPNSQNV